MRTHSGVASRRGSGAAPPSAAAVRRCDANDDGDDGCKTENEVKQMERV
jgi:hypothetical protein